MVTYSTIVRFFQEGGIFMYPIALVLAIGAAVAIERYLYLSREKFTNRRMWEQLMPVLQSGKYQQAAGFSMQTASKASLPILCL